MSEVLDALDAALEENAYHRLEREAPGLARTIRLCIGDGATPHDIYHHTLRKTHNPSLANLCEQAALFLARERG